MTEKLTTAEVRLAATTNLDLPLTQYKKLESGFDAWLAGIKSEAAAAAIASQKIPEKEAQIINTANTTPRVRDPKRKRVRPKKNKQVPAVENPTI
jgi:membrane-bound lytic murein transglycosylase B